MENNFWLMLSRFVIVCLGLIALIVGIYFILPLIYPFLIGIIFALIFNPFVDLLESKAKFPRWLAVTVSILLLLGIIGTVVTLVVIEIVSEVNTLKTTLPGYIEDYASVIQNFIVNDMVTFYDQFTAFYSSLDLEYQTQIEAKINEFASQAVSLVQAGVTQSLNGILTVIGHIPMMATVFIISLLAAFFISKDWPQWRQKFTDIFPDKVVQSSGAVSTDLKKALFGLIRAQLILISITGIIMLIGLLILEVEYALTLSLLIALVDLIPYLGTGAVFVPWIMYLFISGDYSLVIGLSILYGIIIVQRQIMEPKVLGSNVGLDPLLMLFSIFVGYQIFGVLGLILGPVIMVIIGAFYRAGVFRDLLQFIKGGPPAKPTNVD